MTEHATGAGATPAGPASALASARMVVFVATADPSRARAFYAETLGLPLLREDAFALVFEAAGSTLRVTTVPKLARAE